MRFRTLKRTDPLTWAVGVRLGWWPCIPGPFIQVVLGHTRRSFWVERASNPPWEAKWSTQV